MSVKLYTEESIQAIANAIRAKNELTETYRVGDMADAILDIPVGSDLLELLQVNDISHRITLTDEIIKSNATNIRQYTFYNCQINQIDLQKIETIEKYAFYAGSAKSINIPKCKTIGEYAFKDFSRGDDAITTFDFSNLETINQYAFERAKLKNIISLPKCKTIANNVFVETQAGPYGLYAPLVETIGQNAFRSTYFTPDIELPSIKTIGNFAFGNTSSVNFRIGADCTSIGGRIFYSAGVTNLYVLATIPPTLGDKFSDASGYQGVQHIYVPAASVDAYKAANMWSNYASIIEAIPE